MSKDLKIIWHFKEGNLMTDEDKDKVTFWIKQFHEQSLVVFADDLEITIID